MIDELDLISAFRADVPEPDAETRTRARATLIRVMEPGGARPNRLAMARRRSGWRITGAVAATLALALIGPTLFPGRDGTSASAAEFLRKQARIALDQPAVWPPAPGQYLYEERIEWNRACDVPSAHQTRTCTTPGAGAFTHRVWIGSDGSGRECFVGLDGAAGPPCSKDPPGMLTPMDLSNLSTDPNELLALAKAGTLPGIRAGAQARDANLTAGVLSLLVQPAASPALRASLYETAAMLSGTELLGRAKDEIGRDGIGIAYTFRGARDEVIFDPRTSDVLEMKTELVAHDSGGSGAPLGVTTWVLFRTTQLVGAIGDRS
jgi:hypothetical protein